MDKSSDRALVVDPPSDLSPFDAAAPHMLLDITSDCCPMTFVRTRLALDRLEPGQILRLELCGEEPRNNVPRAVRELGHAVIALQTSAGGIMSLLIRKAGAA